MSANKSNIKRNVEQVRQRIAQSCESAGRSPAEVTLIAVTKYVEIDAIQAVIEAGVTDLGESRVQQLSRRSPEIAAWLEQDGPTLPAGVTWHMIGHLQRNKVKDAIAHAALIHSVDSLRLAEELNERAAKTGDVAEVLLQVNCSKEPQKYGVAVGAALHLAEMISTLENVRLGGLMTMAQLSDDAEEARPAFARLRELFEEIRHENIGGESFRHLSMGMSQDYHVAVEEGATLVRVGSAVFE